jgi:hypothetical protein
MSDLNKALWTPPTKPDYKGVYCHKVDGTFLKVLYNSKSHIVVKWGENEVARTVDYLSSYSKIEKLGSNKYLH